MCATGPSPLANAVDGGEGHGGIGEDSVPLAEGLVGGDQGGPALVAGADEFEEHAGLGLIGVAGEELVAVYQSRQCAWLGPECVDDMAVVDDMATAVGAVAAAARQGHEMRGAEEGVEVTSVDLSRPHLVFGTSHGTLTFPKTPSDRLWRLNMRSIVRRAARMAD